MLNSEIKIKSYKSFCEIQEDWVLMTSSQDQPLQKKEALQKFEKLKTATREEKIILNIKKALFYGKLKKKFWTFFLRRILFSKSSTHPWFYWEKALSHIEKGDMVTGNEFGRKAYNNSTNDLSLIRQINFVAPAILRYHEIKLAPPTLKAKIAIAIPGGLRCWSRNFPLIKELLKFCDLFICTTTNYRHILDELKSVKNVHTKIIEDNPSLPVPAMQQWMRLNACLEMIRNTEQENGNLYTHIIKLRTDYFFMDPSGILHTIAQVKSGMAACSDKVFAGDRETMMLLQDFYKNLMDFYVDRDHWFPINTDQILRSDDSFKWFGLMFPEKILKGSVYPAQFRSVIQNHDPDIIKELSELDLNNLNKEKKCKGKWLMQTLYERSPKRKKVFASEICFAAFLNMNNITVTWHHCLSGILWQDRSDEN